MSLSELPKRRHEVGDEITVRDWDSQKEKDIRLKAKVLLSNGDGSIVEVGNKTRLVRKCTVEDITMNTNLRDRTWEALDVWMSIFYQCLDRGDWPGIQEVDDHFGMIGDIKEVF